MLDAAMLGGGLLQQLQQYFNIILLIILSNYVYFNKVFLSSKCSSLSRQSGHQRNVTHCLKCNDLIGRIAARVYLLVYRKVGKSCMTEIEMLG